MKLKLIVIISAVAVIPILTLLFYENFFMRIDPDKQQLIQLALSDSRVKQYLGDKPYHIEFGPDYFVPNKTPPYTDSNIKFIFDNGSYILVRENLFLNQIKDIQLGTSSKPT